MEQPAATAALKDAAKPVLAPGKVQAPAVELPVVAAVGMVVTLEAEANPVMSRAAAMAKRLIENDDDRDGSQTMSIGVFLHCARRRDRALSSPYLPMDSWRSTCR